MAKFKNPDRWKAWAVGECFYGDCPPETRRSRKDIERTQWSASARGSMPTRIFRVEIRVIGRVKPRYYPRTEIKRRGA